MRSQRWRLRAAVTGAAVVALVAATGPTGSAAPPAAAETNPQATPQANPAPSIGETPLSTTDNPAAGGTQVTLITGDVVSYTPGVNGAKPTVEVTSERTGSFTQLQDGEHYYVFPGDTRALVGAGKLDKTLFDVAYLAKNGYADDKTQQLPVIVQYPKPTGSTGRSAPPASSSAAKVLSTKADALPATSHARGLSVVNSAAVQVTKADATKFWSSVDAPKPNSTSLDAGVAKIWLDGRVTASLDVSVPQIGAPEAWAEGHDGTGVKVAVLDTGVDDTHPDLAGRITDSKSFIDGEAVKDGHGHGTHVVSTIIGNGAASGGKYKGVAPGAQMIVGKVLNNAGSGNNSQIIAGMEWAAQSGAKVVSMSLGGCCTDGTDPMAQAVNDISAQYGTLFVIAAGNNGPTGETINTPGSADAALTVAAVDKQDQMASFSSRGPRPGNLGLKPDIAAPGVNITAAKADGTALGPIVDEKYTTISGTSMATPHVAGSAAILAQVHPDWTGQKLKQVLTSTSKDVGHGTYEQGAGRVDIPRATTQPVYATSNVDFGLLAWPHTTPVTRPLTYANDGGTTVTLNLTAEMALSGGSAPAGILSVSPSTVTVPAHGTADVDVTFDAAKGPNLAYGGAVHATSADGSVTVNTAVGARKQARQVKLTMNIINRPEATDIVHYGFTVMRLDYDENDQTRNQFTGPGATETTTVDAGVYSVTNDVTWRDQDGEWNRALFTDPNVDATGDKDVTVTFDLRRAVRDSVRTPKPSIPHYQVFGMVYVSEAPGTQAILEYRLPYGADRMWSLPSSSRTTHGTFTGYSTYYNGIDPVRMRIDGRGGVTLHPQYQAVNNNVTGIRRAKVNMLNLHGQAQLVDAGPGRTEDFARIDARGKIALLDLSEFCPAEPQPNLFGSFCTVDPKERIQNAADAGAIAVLGYGSVGRQFLLTLNEYSVYWEAPTYPVPTMGLTAKEGRMLAARLATGPVTLDVDATEYSPYYYPLSWTSHDSMFAGTRTVTDRDLRRIDNRVHADTPGTSATLSYNPTTLTNSFQPWAQRAYQIIRPAPFTVTTYVGPVTQDVAWTSAVDAQDYSQNRVQRITRAGSDVQDWGEQPLVPSANRADPTVAPYAAQFCHSCRSGNVLAAQRVLTNDGSTGVSHVKTASKPVSELHLYNSDGTEIPQQDALWLWGIGAYPSSYFELPAQRGTYRMTENYATARTNQQFARTVQTERTFASERPDTGYVAADAGFFTGVHCNSWNLIVPDESGQQYRWLDQNPCQPTDELFLGYDFDLNLDNTLPAGSKQDVTVSGYGSPYLKTQPKLTSLTLSLSYDDGRTWQQVKTKSKKDGTFTGKYDIPALSRTTGAVTVRAEATDTNGHTVKQTIARAFGLTSAATHGKVTNAL